MATIYQRLYKKHHGSIPKDNNGRSYDIHHINGDHSDNRIENLVAVPIEEHFKIHYDQGDYAAAKLIAARIDNSPNLLKELASKSSKKRVADGTHNFLGGAIQTKSNLNRAANGTHPFLGGDLQRKRLAEGTHPFVVKMTCPHCNKTLDKANYAQYHGDKCKYKPIYASP